MSEAPPFWFDKPGATAWLLSPFGALYGYGAARRMAKRGASVSKLPVICIGNLIVGGAGKTPTAVALAKVAQRQGLKPGFLSRGYGANISSPTLVDIKAHNARDVGDEPLILGLYGPTVVSPDRPAGAAFLEQQGVDLIIMDDGFQNPSLHKDYALAVVDARRGIGNGFCIPAGPLRAPLKKQLNAADAILLIGRSQAGTDIVRRAAKMAKPILTADVMARMTQDWKERPVLAFAGIADPEKFYRTVEQMGAKIVERRNFHDHHPFSDEECRELINEAQVKGLTLVTTEKDSVRLIRMGALQQELRAACEVINIDLVFENDKMAEMILQTTLKKAQDFRLTHAVI